MNSNPTHIITVQPDFILASNLSLRVLSNCNRALRSQLHKCLSCSDAHMLRWDSLSAVLPNSSGHPDSQPTAPIASPPRNHDPKLSTNARRAGCIYSRIRVHPLTQHAGSTCSLQGRASSITHIRVAIRSFELDQSMKCFMDPLMIET